MSTQIKYRIHEVAKDFGMTSRDLGRLLRDFGTEPKNHMQILTADELNYLFERITAEHRVDNLAEALAKQMKDAPPKQTQSAPKQADAEPKAAAKEAAPTSPSAAQQTPSVTKQTESATKQAESAPKQAESAPKQVESAPKQAAPAPSARRDNRDNRQASGERSRQQPQSTSDRRGDRRSATDNRFANRPDTAQTRQKPAKPAQAAQSPAPARAKGVTIPLKPPDRPAPSEPVVVSDADATGRKGRYVDTRGTSVNLARYDERIDSLVPETVANTAQSKQKLTKKRNDRKGFVGSKRRAEEAEKMRRMQRQIEQKKVQLKVLVPDEISVGELALRLKKTAADVIKRLMKMGVMASVSQFIDFDTASLIAMDFGAKVEREIIMTIEDKLIDTSEDREENLMPRDPVVVVMGHVDHGKTSLLDALRRANVAEGEAGGITQHIGAYRVKLGGREITFLDTPGHAAFTSMRARGASVTDVVILVVAADDGIMPQTIEAINHAKNAGVPVVVAINKIDRPNAQPDRVLTQLSEHGLVPESWGGDTITCLVSAKEGTGLDSLLEMVLLTADMLELRANPDRLAAGTVVEAKLDRGRGPVATVLVQNGTLKTGDVIIAGKSVGRVRIMTDENGKKLETAGPSVPVEIVGLSEVPGAGDRFHAVEDERMARELVEQRKTEEKDAAAQSMQRVSLDSLFDYIKEGEMKELGIIVKADVHGTSEAVKASLEKITSDEVRVRVIHTGVGAINESDVMLASAANAIIVGFNVRPSQGAVENGKLHGVDIRLYRVIYDCIEEMEAAMKGMLAPKFREVVLGHAEVRQIFRASGIGTIAGCYVQNGKIVRGASVRIVRDGVVVHEGEMASLKRFKDDAREVATGYECGISIERFNDIKESDVIEAYTMEEIKP